MTNYWLSPFVNIWQCVKTWYPCSSPQNSWDLWMFITLKMVLIGIDPYPYIHEDSGACEADLLTAHPRPTLGQTTSSPQWFRFPIEVAISAGLDTPNHIAPSLSAEIKSKIDASCIEKPFSDKDHISPYKIFLR